MEVSERFFTIKEIAKLTGKSEKTIRRYVNDGILKPITDNKMQFTEQEIENKLQKKPTIKELSIAILGKTRVGKSTLKNMILAPESRSNIKEVTTVEGDTKVSINYVIKRELEQPWRIVSSKASVLSLRNNIAKEILEDLKNQEKEKLIDLYSESDDINKVKEYVKYSKNKGKKEELEGNELHKKLEEINKITVENLSLEQKKNINKKTIEELIEILKKINKKYDLTEELLDLKNGSLYEELENIDIEQDKKIESYEDIHSEEDYEDIHSEEEYLECKNNYFNKTGRILEKKVNRSLEIFINELKKEEFENIDSVELAKVILGIDVEVKMDPYIASKVGIDILKITDTRGAGDSEDVLKRDIFVNAFDVILVMMGTDEGSEKRVEDILRTLKIVSSNIEIVIVDKNIENNISNKDEREEIDKNSIKAIEDNLKKLKIIPNNIYAYEDLLSVILNSKRGSILPRISKNLKDEEEMKKSNEFYQDAVIEMLNKLAYSKFLSINILSDINDKLKDSISIVENLSENFSEKIAEKAIALNNGKPAGLRQMTRRSAFRNNSYEVLVEGNNGGWPLQYIGHYLTEAGAVIFKESLNDIKNLNENEKFKDLFEKTLNLTDNNKEALNLTEVEQVVLFRELYKYILNLPKYKMYEFGTLYSINTERLSYESLSKALGDERKILIQLNIERNREDDFSVETINILKNMIEYDIQNLLKGI